MDREDRAELSYEMPLGEGSIWETVRQLPEGYRDVIHLFYYEQYSVREIGEILELTEGAVKTRLVPGAGYAAGAAGRGEVRMERQREDKWESSYRREADAIHVPEALMEKTRQAMERAMAEEAGVPQPENMRKTGGKRTSRKKTAGDPCSGQPVCAWYSWEAI